MRLVKRMFCKHNWLYSHKHNFFITGFDGERRLEKTGEAYFCVKCGKISHTHWGMSRSYTKVLRDNYFNKKDAK